MKKRILDEFCQTTGMHRKAAIRLLGRPARPVRARRGRPPRYGPDVAAALAKLWEVGDRMCGKLLVAVLPDLLAALERHGDLRVSPQVRELLLTSAPPRPTACSASTDWADCGSPSGAAPARPSRARSPFAPGVTWGDAEPGSLQADLVLHCGERTEGFYLTTLCAVDVASGWTELQPVWGMGKQRVGAAIYHVRQRLPFPLTALHTGNGSEFINHVLYPWCQREGIAFTRGRGYRKNDQAYVEQKNWLTVRRPVGYGRYTTRQAFALLQQLYPLLTLQGNFFRPVRKLVGKERQGAKVVKRYDQPQTPYQRLLAAQALTSLLQAALEERLLAINPARVRRQIDELLQELWRTAKRPDARGAYHAR